MNNIMLDLETLGTAPGSVVVTIGACFFGGGEIGPTFYERIDIKDSQAHGLKIDTDTILWWFKQNEEARLEMTKQGESLSRILSRFGDWIQEGMAKSYKGAMSAADLTDFKKYLKTVTIWGNGAAFDNTLLSAVYSAAGHVRPWSYSNDRCYRTLKSLFPQVELVREGTYHNALSDAISQAKHLMEIQKFAEQKGLSLTI